MKLFDTDGADEAYERCLDPPEPREPIDEGLLAEEEDLRIRNQEEIKHGKILDLEDTLEDLMSDWKLEFKVVNDGINIMDGERCVAKVFNPVDAQRFMQIFRMHDYMAKVAIQSLEVISDLQKHAFGPAGSRALKFVTDTNYMIDVLKHDASVTVDLQKSLDESKSKA